MDLVCTDCDTTLHAHAYEAVSIHRCPDCAGTFVGHGELVRIMDEEHRPRDDAERRAAAEAATGRAIDHAGSDGVRRCAVCRGFMRRYVYRFSSGVVVDACDAHGLWLDAGELQRIEAWSEAGRRGLVPEADAETARTARPAPTHLGRPSDAEQDQQLADRARLATLFGFEAMAMHAEVKRIAGRFAAERRTHAATRDQQALAITTARARAEGDAVPTAEQGAVCQRASCELAVGIDVAWPLLADIRRLPRWMAGLDTATIVSGRGSSRVHELGFSNHYRVRQRVTRLAPDRTIAWRDTDEWLQGLEVPAWNAGSWTELHLERLSAGGCRVELVTTQLPGDDEQVARIHERAPALQRWLDDCTTRLAAAAAGS